MNWTRSETLALASQACTFCFGLGLRPGRGGDATPCNCVFRAIFRACYARFHNCGRAENMARVSLEQSAANGFGYNDSPRRRWTMKNQDYLADFFLVSRRVLGEDTPLWRIFRFHYLLGADWKLCCRRLGMERGAFFHDVYRIQQKLGRAFRELEPYALFPLDEYFSTPQGPRALAASDAFPIAS